MKHEVARHLIYCIYGLASVAVSPGQSQVPELLTLSRYIPEDLTTVLLFVPEVGIKYIAIAIA